MPRRPHRIEKGALADSETFDEKVAGTLYGRSIESAKLPQALASLLVEKECASDRTIDSVDAHAGRLAAEFDTTDEEEFHGCLTPLRQFWPSPVDPEGYELLCAARRFATIWGRHPTLRELLGEAPLSAGKNPKYVRRRAKDLGICLSPEEEASRIRRAHRDLAKALDRLPTAGEFHRELDLLEIAYPNIYDGGLGDIGDVASAREWSPGHEGGSARRVDILHGAALSERARCLWNVIVHAARPAIHFEGEDVSTEPDAAAKRDFERLLGAYETEGATNGMVATSWPEFDEVLRAILASQIRHFGESFGLELS